MISGKFNLNKNVSINHNSAEPYYLQNDQYYPWFNKNENEENQTLTYVKWTTDQTNIKNPDCTNTLYTPRNTKYCLNPENSKSTLILFGASRTKQLYLAFKALLNEKITSYDDNKMKIIGNKYFLEFYHRGVFQIGVF